MSELVELWRLKDEIRRSSRWTWKRGDSLGNFLAKVAAHESEQRGVSGLRSEVDPTGTVVFSGLGSTSFGSTGFGSTGSGFMGPVQLPHGLGAAIATVATVARAAAKRVKKCMTVFMMLGS